MSSCVVKKKKVIKEDDRHYAFSSIITRCPRMQSIFTYMKAIAKTSKQVLITGETGVGKELIAKAIHELSGLKGKLVVFNASTLSDDLFSDTLFGHKKGAYTGAISDRKGLIENAAGGTLFLDEIGDMCHESQVKLLRLIQEKEYYPVGSDVPKKTDTRIIVATNRDLNFLMSENKFRNDLYYRLKIHHIHLPPLRERLADIPLLVEHFLSKAAFELGKRNPMIPAEVVSLLRNYPFPGNIRELEAMMFDAVSSHDSPILSLKIFKNMMDFPNYYQPDMFTLEKSDLFKSGKFPTLKEAANFLIEEALKRANNNQSIAAGLLGITRQALNRRLKKAEINSA